MQHIATKETTHTLGAPADWDVERLGTCVPLPVAVIDGNLHSFWLPSEEERAMIASGAPIRLVVAGLAHPAVKIEVG